MARVFLLIFTALQLSICFAGGNDEEWIDPHDMSSSSDYVPYHYESSKSNQQAPIQEPNCEAIEAQSRAYLKRTINLILNAVHEESSDDFTHRGHLVFEISAEKFLKLQAFAEGDFDDLVEVDAILRQILRKPDYNYLQEYFLPFAKKIGMAAGSRMGVMFVCSLAYCFVIYKMLVGNFDYCFIFKFLFVNIVLFDFVFVWIRLYKAKEIDRIAGMTKYLNAPDYCNPAKMGTMQILWNALGSTADQCRDYHHITLTDIFWLVSPGDVLVEMFSRSVFNFLVALGPAIGKFVFGIYDQLPWFTSIVLLPVILIFLLVSLCIVLSFTLGTSIKFNFFHLISFSFGDTATIQTASRTDNVLTGRTVDQLLDMVRDSSVPRLSDPVPSNVPSSAKKNVLTVQHNLESDDCENSTGDEHDKENVDENARDCTRDATVRKRKAEKKKTE